MYSYEECLEESKKYFNGNDLSAQVFLDKYALKDNKGNLLEKTPTDMHRRLAREFARIEQGKFSRPFTEEELFSFFDRFEKIIPQGSPMYGIGNPYQYVSLSNCFVIESPVDSYGGICKADEELAQISKRRGGVGLDLSLIRPAGCSTKNSSKTSTGVIPFMSRFSNTIREVGQDGRRGAEMLTIDIKHPESICVWEDKDGESTEVTVEQENFSFKTTTEYYNPKKIDFITAKYDRTKVTGANISVRVSNEFMEAVQDDKDFVQQWPVDSDDPRIKKVSSARKMWDKLIRSAWQTAEPGILFWDRIINESPADCYREYGFETVSTNPCGEIPLSGNYDSCRLLSINLFGFVVNPFTKDAYFDFKKFYKYAKIAQRLMDDLIDLEIQSVQRIIDKIKNDPESNEIKQRELSLWENVKKAAELGRRTGTGITALGDTLAALGLPYGSQDSIDLTARIYKCLKFACYESSVEMAEELGPFPIFEYELEKYNPFLNRIKREKIIFDENDYINGDDIYERMKKSGRRNIALLTTAPTGTISIIAKLINRFYTSSGIEPVFSIDPYIRRKKINPGDKTKRVDFIDQNGDCWEEFKIYPTNVLEWMDVTGETDINKSPWKGSTASELDWEKRVLLQSKATYHIDHSVSSTLNVHKDITVDEVKEIYFSAWKYGCKGITIYRDGCRSGVLVKDTPKNEIKKEIILKTKAPKRPDRLKAKIYHPSLKGVKYFVVVGMLDDDPYEVFAGLGHNFKQEEGYITKVKSGVYDLRCVKDDSILIENLSGCSNDNEEALLRIISTALRHGSDIKFITEQLEKTRGDLYSFTKIIARVLKKFIPDGTVVKGEVCPTCSIELIRESGCVQCKSCGYSKC